MLGLSGVTGGRIPSAGKGGTAVAVFSQVELEAVSNALGDIELGFTGQ